jgi:hypothetical protein
VFGPPLQYDAGARGWPEVVRERAWQWDGRFFFRAEQANGGGTVEAGKRGLRPPQIGALHAIGAHWSIHKQPATVALPTGTGKAETMLAASLATYSLHPSPRRANTIRLLFDRFAHRSPTEGLSPFLTNSPRMPRARIETYLGYDKLKRDRPHKGDGLESLSEVHLL